LDPFNKIVPDLPCVDKVGIPRVLAKLRTQDGQRGKEYQEEANGEYAERRRIGLVDLDCCFSQTKKPERSGSPNIWPG
jgi:hypothetical protein